MASTPSRICPACGARNNDRSLFCAECGASLATDTGAWNDNEATQSFEPVRGETTWDRSSYEDQRTSNGGYAVVETSTPPPYATFDQPWGTTPTPVASQSQRGFWLGLLAWILIAVVIGMYIWAGLLGDQLKDDIRDIVPGLSHIVVLGQGH